MPEVQTCSNCRGSIGVLEKSFVWRGYVVCSQCYKKLSAADEPAPLTQHISNAQLGQQPDQITKWINIYGYVSAGLALLAGFLGTVSEIPPGVDLLSLPLAGLGLFFGVMGYGLQSSATRAFLTFHLPGQLHV